MRYTRKSIARRLKVPYAGGYRMSNVFLTGAINIGKSTIVSRVMAEFLRTGISTAGFYTLPYAIGGAVKGYYIHPLFPMELLPLPEKRIIGTIKGDQWAGVTQTFESIGTEILEQSLAGTADLVIMDELGFFEEKAFGFQDRVVELLDSPKTVLGVIKPSNLPFLNDIRKRDDVWLLEVTRANRSHLAGRVLEGLRGNGI